MTVHQLNAYTGPSAIDGRRIHVYITTCGKKVGVPHTPPLGGSVKAGEGDDACPVCFPPQAPVKQQVPRRQPDEDAPPDAHLDDSLGNLEVDGDDKVLEEQMDQWGETRSG